MKIKTVIVLIMLCVLFLSACGDKEAKVSSLIVESQSFEGFYQYPEIKENMNDKKNLDAFRIDKKVLESMSTEQLVQAVFDFPLLYDVLFSNDKLCNTDILKEESDAYKELLIRDDAKDVFIFKIKELEQKNYDSVKIEVLKSVMINEEIFQKQFSKEDLEYLKE